MPDMSAPIAQTLSDEDLMALYSERRLANMRRGEAWFYRRYRRLPPRARMLLANVVTCLLAWFTLHGIARIVDGVSASHLVIVSVIVAIALGSLSRNVPFQYR